MIILYGQRPRPIGLSATRKYRPEEVWEMLDRLVKADQSLFIRVENEYLRVNHNEIDLAAAIVASYHNQLAYNAPPDDGWREETEEMEAAARARTEGGRED